MVTSDDMEVRVLSAPRLPDGEESRRWRRLAELLLCPASDPSTTLPKSDGECQNGLVEEQAHSGVATELEGEGVVGVGAVLGYPFSCRSSSLTAS